MKQSQQSRLAVQLDEVFAEHRQLSGEARFTFDFKFWFKAAEGVFFFSKGSILVKIHFYVFKRWLGFLIVIYLFYFSAIRGTLGALFLFRNRNLYH